IQSEKSAAPQMRPLIEVDLLAPKRLKIFVNHWKSKSGSGDSNLWRRWQEGLLARKIIEAQNEIPNAAILCAGDFNQDISEFAPVQNRSQAQDERAGLFGADENFSQAQEAPAASVPNIELRAPFFGQKVLVYSPWLDYDGEIGSYNFRDKWERIDHFFCCGAARLKNFGPQTGEWSYEDGRPKPFKIYSLGGWSDHLPIACSVEW
ncbi:MAG: hypothetical protein J5700_00490, partial [Treponema sp.]|nr:hypothetical protein [Treponema sp.]